jgi:phage host-nuclease inhibitor protein Gam
MQKVKSFWGAMFSQVGFFYLVLLVFMAVSVTESGDFFNKAITHDVFAGSLGYAVAAVFDLLSLVFMLARLNAGRIADRRGEWLSLFGVIICAAVSAFANMASAVQTYDASQFNHIPAWMQSAAPYLGMVFPAMIIVVSIISDHIGDLNPQRADSIEKYRLKEQKKVDLLRVRLDIEKQLAETRKEMAELHQKPSKKVQRLHQQQTQTINTLQASYDARINDLSNEITSLKMLLEPVVERNTDEMETVDRNVAETVDKTGTRKGDTSVLRKARRLLKSHQNMRPADIAKRLQISPSYASQLKTKVLAESLQPAS